MQIKFEIPDEKTRYLNQKGKTELIRHCKQLTDEIIDEATRIEASRNTSGNTEITAAIISEAVVYSKRFPSQKKKKFSYKIVQIIAFISSIITGGLFDIDKFNVESRVVWFCITLLIASATTVYLIFNGDQNG